MKRYGWDVACLAVCLLCAGVQVYRGDMFMALVFAGGAVAWIGRLTKMAKEPEKTEKKPKKTKR